MGTLITSNKKQSKVISLRVQPELLEQIEKRALDLGITNPFAADGAIAPNISAYLLSLAKADLGQDSSLAPSADRALADTVADLVERVEALESELRVSGESLLYLIKLLAKCHDNREILKVN
jgi:hypothetical protein